MKGLLLKEWYLIKRYCRVYLIITALFLALSAFYDGNSFILFYPSLLCGMIPVNLQSFDERSGWSKYSGALPYTKSQLVSVKYLTGLLAVIAIMSATVVIQTIKAISVGEFSLHRLFVTIFVMSILEFFFSSLCLPLVFKFGTEKGRIVYIVMVGIFCGVLASISGGFAKIPVLKINTNMLLICILLAGCALYAASWTLSIALYKKREI